MADNRSPNVHREKIRETEWKLDEILYNTLKHYYLRSSLQDRSDGRLV